MSGYVLNEWPILPSQSGDSEAANQGGKGMEEDREKERERERERDEKEKISKFFGRTYWASDPLPCKNLNLFYDADYWH